MGAFKKGKQERLELGKRYRDTITGFEGVATAQTEYLFGCFRVGLCGVLNGEPKDFTFDAPQLEVVEAAPAIKPQQRTGGPHATPSRAGL
jgi:hypothetical protein